VLLRRAIVDDVLPGNYKVKAGQDIMISVYNIHRSPEVLLHLNVRLAVFELFKQLLCIGWHSRTSLSV
jgi:hypothetical protein